MVFIQRPQDDLVLKHDAGRIIAQALADLSNASDWVRMVNGTSQYAPLSNRALFLEYLKKVRLNYHGVSSSSTCFQLPYFLEKAVVAF